MINIANHPNVNGSWPNVTAKAVSGLGSKDGTPFTTELLDDIWGFYQHLLYKCGISPSGTTENSTTSQLVQAIQKICGTPGELVYFMGTMSNLTTLTSSGLRLLPLDGSVYAISNYGDLVTATYCGDANNGTAEGFYKTSDSGGQTRSTSGTYFVLPDYRGVFVRCYDERTSGRTYEPDTRFVNNVQGHAIKKHSHNVFYGSQKLETAWATTTGSTIPLAYFNNTGMGVATTEYGGSYMINEETRPVNRAIISCVRY